MQNARALSITAICLTAAAIALNAAVGQIPLLVTRQVPVAQLPHTIGTWSGGADRAVDPEIQKKLPTATLVDRVYTATDGRSVQFLLVSARRSDDIHQPTVCLPSQGWHLSDQHTINFHGQPISVMTASLDGNDMRVYYWYSNADPNAGRESRSMRLVRRLRSYLVPTDEGRSLLGRLIVEQPSNADRTATGFLEAAWPEIEKLVRAAQTAPAPQ